MRFRWVVTSKPEYRGAEAGAAQRERHDGTDGAAGRSCVPNQLQSIETSGGPLDTLLQSPRTASSRDSRRSWRGCSASAQLAERLGELHPDMIKMDTAIASAEGRLKAETDKVVASIRNDFSTAQARERALIAALDAQKREVLELNQQSIGYGALQRDAASTQQIFESVLQRLKETELSGELKSNNVRIVDMAAVPRVPIRPRKLVNVLVALVGGGFIALALVIGLERLNPRMSGPEHISDMLGLPYFGIAQKSMRSKRHILWPAKCLWSSTKHFEQSALGSFYRRLPTSRRWR